MTTIEFYDGCELRCDGREVGTKYMADEHRAGSREQAAALDA